MNIGKIGSAAQAYSRDYKAYSNNAEELNKSDKATLKQSEIKESNKEDNRKVGSENNKSVKTSFSEEAADLKISQQGKNLAQDKKTVYASDDGKVVSKARDDVKKDTEKKAEEQVTNLTGYTSNQVESLYRQGRISRDKYQQKMDKIEELRESAGIKADDKEKVQAKANESKISENRNINNDNLKRSDNKIQNDSKDEKKADKAKEDTKQTIESNKKQSETFGKILQNEEKVQNEEKAYEKAIENGRLELVKPIFDDEKTKEMQLVVGNV